MKFIITKYYKKLLLIILLIFSLNYTFKTLNRHGKLSEICHSKFLQITENKKFLNFIARFYFDEGYYLKNYPEISKLHISPFKHYSKIGWKEGKNPNKNFDNNFYMRVYKAFDKSIKQLNPLQHSIRCKLQSEICYTHPMQLKKATLLKNPKYYLALVSLFRNEARFLKEWIEFYKLMGVEHFYLYNHLSEDNYMEVLEPYIKDGTVELQNLTIVPKNWGEWRLLQLDTYNKTIEKTKDIVEWLIVGDSDEFLFPIKEKDLKAVLKKYDNYASLSVNWRRFGSGIVEKIEPSELLIESLTMAEKPGDLHVKTIVKPRYVEEFTNPHFAVLKPGYKQITENYEYFYGPFSPHQSFNTLKINHYWARDWQFFKENKLSHVHILANPDLSSQSEKNSITEKNKQISNVNEQRSTDFDDSITKFAPALRAILFKNGEK